MPRLIDLSHPLVQGQPVFPSDPPLTVEAHDTTRGAGYNTTRLSLCSHQGTHLDAPFHFYDDGKTLDQINLERFYGPASLIDLAPGSFLPAGTPLTVEMLQPFERVFQPGARVIYRTGWDRVFGRPEFFCDCPSLTLDAVRWIAARQIGLLGMDTPTPAEDWKEPHLILLARDQEVVIVESLANLSQLPERFLFAGFPLNIQGRDGSPIRAVAVVD